MKNFAIFTLFLLALGSELARGEALEAGLQAKVDARITAIQEWAKDPVLVRSVQTQNDSPSPDAVAMTQEKWKSLTVLDPLVRSFTRNPAADFLKGRKTDAVSEAFVSDASGAKVAFLAKTSGWSHKGKPKHDVPMSGKVWQGPVEVDESTGLQQVQVSVPVLDGDKPIGSLVVGLSLSKLSSQ